MRFTTADIRRLRLPVVVSLIVALTGVACYYGADSYLQDSKQLASATSAQRAEVQNKLARANEEEREIKANLQQYQALAARGIIGEEKRLDWVDALTAIKNERRLFNISYSIEPQKPVDYPGFVAGSGVDFVASRVALRIQLLHEEDLLNLITDLLQRSRSYLSVRSCDLQRMDRGGTGTALAPRLEATCVLDLITIRHKKPA